MSLIQIKSVGGEVSVVVDGHDITGHVLAEPPPTVFVAGASGQSQVTLTLIGDLDLEVDGMVVTA